MAMTDTFTPVRDDFTGREAPGWRPATCSEMPEPLAYDPDFTNAPVFVEEEAVPPRAAGPATVIPPGLAALTRSWLEGGQ